MVAIARTSALLLHWRILQNWETFCNHFAIAILIVIPSTEENCHRPWNRNRTRPNNRIYDLLRYYYRKSFPWVEQELQMQL